MEEITTPETTIATNTPDRLETLAHLAGACGCSLEKGVVEYWEERLAEVQPADDLDAPVEEPVIEFVDPSELDKLTYSGSLRSFYGRLSNK